MVPIWAACLGAYREGDLTRRPSMAERLEEARGEGHWFAIATAAEQRMRETKGIIANVDYFAEPVLHHLGFRWSCLPM